MSETHRFTLYTILNLCPAPPGARLAYAMPTDVGGVWYTPCYFLAVCDAQDWIAEGPQARRSKRGEPQRVVMPVCTMRDFIGIADEENFLDVLMPGEELDETDHRVIAARAAARKPTTG